MYPFLLECRPDLTFHDDMVVSVMKVEASGLTVFLQNSILRKAKQAAVFFPLKQALFPCVFDLFTVQMADWEHRVKMGLLDQISKARQIS